MLRVGNVPNGYQPESEASLPAEIAEDFKHIDLALTSLGSVSVDLSSGYDHLRSVVKFLNVRVEDLETEGLVLFLLPFLVYDSHIQIQLTASSNGTLFLHLQAHFLCHRDHSQLCATKRCGERWSSESSAIYLSTLGDHFAPIRIDDTEAYSRSGKNYGIRCRSTIKHSLLAVA